MKDATALEPLSLSLHSALSLQPAQGRTRGVPSPVTGCVHTCPGLPPRRPDAIPLPWRLSPRPSAELWPLPPARSPPLSAAGVFGFPCFERSVFSFHLAVTAVTWKARSTAPTRGHLVMAFLFLLPRPERRRCAEHVCPQVTLPEAGPLKAGGAGPGSECRAPVAARAQSSRSRPVWPGASGAARAQAPRP